MPKASEYHMAWHVRMQRHATARRSLGRHVSPDLPMPIMMTQSKSTGNRMKSQPRFFTTPSRSRAVQVRRASTCGKRKKGVRCARMRNVRPAACGR